MDLLSIHHERQALVATFIFLAMFFLFKNAFYGWLVFMKGAVVYDDQVRLGDRLFRAYMKADYPFFLSRNSAELLRNINNETKLVVSDVVLPLMQMIMDGLVLIMIAFLLLSVEPVISLLTFSLLGLISFLFLKIANRKNKSYGKEAQLHRRQMNKIVLEGISGIKEIKVLGREENFLHQYHLCSVRTAVSLRYKQMVSQLPKPFMETIAVTGMIFIALLLLLMNRNVDVYIPVLALFGAAALRLLPIFRTMVTSYTDFKYSACAVDPIFDDLKILESEKNDSSEDRIVERIEPYPFVSEIVFKNVSYHYPRAETDAIRQVDLRIPKGAVVGLVGPSGAGKTTIVDILLGLLKPQQGEVLVDRQNIFQDIKRWQMNVGYVPQSIYLSDESIRRNIAFGMPDHAIDDGQIEQALQAAQLAPLVCRLPGGLNTVVKERGVRLSGGERQRIGIARALYHNPQVLIMDEATSALDNLTEKSVIESIESLRGDRTIILIAHRLTTVRSCDVIYLMDEGRVVEHGSYDDLVNNSSSFRKMNLMES
ncbi:MAG TPA: ABC transporter ATP-binding protein [Smithella sp.]|nr:ABC transporter ATP-binding protein [Smithella sp.]HRS97375.1 ABC transporter ATP-binding protein [Smithella sp.]